MPTDPKEERKKLRQRLSRLGSKPPEKSPRRSDTRAEPADRLGRPVETPHGPAFIIEERFSLEHAIGQRSLGEHQDFDPRLAAQVARDEGLAQADPARLLFVDTETTGLVGGAGTIVFLVGLGSFEEQDFVLRQYFLHDPGEEAAMLHLLQGHLDEASGFVSFNGRAFDLPLVEMRYRLGLKQRLALTNWPHLDLLFPSRRLWRRTLPNCTLGTLEQRVLGVERSEEDVPGEWIPGIYQDYLRSGDLREVRRVVYHNRIDILSLVGLSVEVLRRHAAPPDAELSGAEALGVARWHESAGRQDSAGSAFLAAVESKNEQVRLEALRHWTAHLKRQGQREEALPFWEKWHQQAEDDPRPCIELAIYFEWHASDLELAAEWAQAALVALSHWPAGWRREQAWREIEHRIARIERKRAAVRDAE